MTFMDREKKHDQDFAYDVAGFRRPGFSIDIEPGLSISRGEYTFTLSGPVALVRHEERSIRDLQAGTRSAGGFADFLIFASVSRRF